MISVNKKMGESIEVMLMRTIYQLEAVLLLVLGLFSILDTGDISLRSTRVKIMNTYLNARALAHYTCMYFHEVQLRVLATYASTVSFGHPEYCFLTVWTHKS